MESYFIEDDIATIIISNGNDNVIIYQTPINNANITNVVKIFNKYYPLFICNLSRTVYEIGICLSQLYYHISFPYLS